MSDTTKGFLQKVQTGGRILKVCAVAREGGERERERERERESVEREGGGGQREKGMKKEKKDR